MHLCLGRTEGRPDVREEGIECGLEQSSSLNLKAVSPLSLLLGAVGQSRG